MAQAVTVKVYGRLDFGHLFNPYVSKDFPNADPKYRANIILDPKNPKCAASLEQLKQAFLKIGKEAWGKWPQAFTGDPKRFCLSDGNLNIREVKNPKTGELEDEVRNGYAGMQVLKASTANAPIIKDANGTTDLKVTDGRPYNGCWCNFVVNLKDTDKGGKGLFAYLEIVQFVKNDEVLGGAGRARAEDHLADESEDTDEV